MDLISQLNPIIGCLFVKRWCHWLWRGPLRSEFQYRSFCAECDCFLLTVAVRRKLRLSKKSFVRFNIERDEGRRPLVTSLLCRPLAKRSRVYRKPRPSQYFTIFRLSSSQFQPKYMSLTRFSPLGLSYVAVSRLCCWSEFYPNSLQRPCSF